MRRRTVELPKGSRRHTSRLDARLAVLSLRRMAQVMSMLSSTPLHFVCDLQNTAGAGDKAILRRLARALGLRRAASLQKRAIQFGTRIANKNICGAAPLDPTVDVAEIVHPSASAVEMQSEMRRALSKKRRVWGSTRAARAADARHRHPDAEQPQLDTNKPQLDKTQPQLDAEQPQLDAEQPQLDAEQPQLDAEQH
eukprot:2361520-Pleurochrysis_carterae.AAC.1